MLRDIVLRWSRATCGATVCWILAAGCGCEPEQSRHEQAGLKSRKEFTNSIGMKFVRIGRGGFMMGESNTPIPYELTEPLSYPRKEELKKQFPHGDPDKLVIGTRHVDYGDPDEHPVHRVNISRPFYMGVCEVTNAQYEEFDPSHRKLRGKNGFSKADDEAVIFVSWRQARDFCKWLSKKEGEPYRLPTEAEWE